MQVSIENEIKDNIQFQNIDKQGKCLSTRCLLRELNLICQLIGNSIDLVFQLSQSFSFLMQTCVYLPKLVELKCSY